MVKFEEAALARQRCSKHISIEINKSVTAQNAVFSIWSVWKLHKNDQKQQQSHFDFDILVGDSRSSWLGLWVGPLCFWEIWVRGPGPSCWGSLRWNSNIWLWVLRDSNQCVTALQITDPSSLQRGCPIWRRKKVIVKQRKLLKSGHGPHTLRWTGRLTNGHNITLIWTWKYNKSNAWGYNWATLFLEDINMGTWSPGWVSLRWDSNMWLWVLRDCNQCVIALQITDLFPHQEGYPTWRRKKLSFKEL
jgi:hypothetical protein